jgi:putative membrane protein
MMWDGNGYFGGAGWGGWFMIVLMALFMVAIVIAVIYFVRFLAQPQSAPPQVYQAMPPITPHESPKDILQRRYAAGEIDRDEYLLKLGDL